MTVVKDNIITKYLLLVWKNIILHVSFIGISLNIYNSALIKINLKKKC